MSRVTEIRKAVTPSSNEGIHLVWNKHGYQMNFEAGES